MFSLNTAGFDSSLHISEEAENARVAVPRGLVGATAVAGIMGWGGLPVTLMLNYLHNVLQRSMSC